jgi:hypothetical protein
MARADDNLKRIGPCEWWKFWCTSESIDTYKRLPHIGAPDVTPLKAQVEGLPKDTRFLFFVRIVMVDESLYVREPRASVISSLSSPVYEFQTRSSADSKVKKSLVKPWY